MVIFSAYEVYAKKFFTHVVVSLHGAIGLSEFSLKFMIYSWTMFDNTILDDNSRHEFDKKYVYAPFSAYIPTAGIP